MVLFIFLLVIYNVIVNCPASEIQRSTDVCLRLQQKNEKIGPPRATEGRHTAEGPPLGRRGAAEVPPMGRRGPPMVSGIR